ncbi:hypothetical protein [Limnovirga soli]|uniref:Uncharacterized protein n=1 Tax=Limnovirga soli TaxID=2656915 RepID=A0A8J8FDH1_9BACT|nr:hypothetical protein [Limnovirga soli]NNV53881.1 hypothetical protein [Limnovirga soli]
MKLPTLSKKAKKRRLEEWNTWLHNFEQQNLDEKGNPKFIYIPNAAWLLNDLYWRLVEQYLRPLLATDKEDEEEHRIHPSKIIAASEITIMMTLPIQFIGDALKEKKVNATLAWFVATQIMEGWKTGWDIEVTSEQITTVAMFKEPIDKTIRYPQSFAAEHVNWLAYLNVTIEKPLLLLAQCWRLFYISCLSIAEGGNLK